MKEIMKQHYNLSYVLTKLSVLTNNKSAYTEEEAIQIQKALTQYKDITTRIEGLFTEFNQVLVNTIKQQPQQGENTPFENLPEEQVKSIIERNPKLFVVTLSETTQLHIQSLNKNNQPIPKEFDFFVEYVLVRANSTNHALKVAQNHVDSEISTNDYSIEEVELSSFFSEYDISESDKRLIEDNIATTSKNIYTKMLH